ncbi:uncharacterized protein LOC144646617 [Oculina patagonica]
MATALRKTKDAVKKKFGKKGKNPDDKSREEQEKEEQRKSSSLTTNKKDVGRKEFDSLPDDVSNMRISEKAPVSQPSVSGQGTSECAASTDDGVVSLNPKGEASGDGVAGSEPLHSQELNVAGPAQADGIVPPDPNSKASRNGVAGSELPQSQELNVAGPAEVDGEAPPNSNREASGDGVAGSDSPNSQELNVADPAQADGVVPPEASRDQGSASGHGLLHNQQIDAAAAASAVPPPAAAATANEEPQNSAEGTARVVVPNSASRNGEESLNAAAAQPPPQNENNLESLTGTPIQEEADGTVDDGTTGDETTQQEEAANSYESFLVSDIVKKNKFLEDKLASELDHTSHRVIKTWEHLSCTKEVDAPLETRIRCKLNSEYSCAEMLFDLLVVEKGDKTVQDLIAALKTEAVKRNDVAKVITDVYPDAETSTETLSDFAASDANSELIKKMATKLDQKSRVIGYWKTLGQQFKISGEKLKEIECGQFNPTLALMEYLYSKRADLKVKEFYEVVKNLKRNDVLKKLDPYLVDHIEKAMKDVIEPESEVMTSICVCLNNPNRVLKNWRNLANAFNVPRDIYKDFNPKEPKRPTVLLLEWIYANKTDLTVGQLCAALQSIDRNDVVRDIRKHFEQPANGH